MTDHRPPPPEPEACLTQTRVSRYRGGTVIAEHVSDMATHVRLLADPDGYRLEACPRCGGDTLHVHDYPHLALKGWEGPPSIRLVRYLCVRSGCKATWRILPLLVPRHVWRVWSAVEGTVGAGEPAEPLAKAVPAGVKAIPARTAQRWRARLESAARQLVVLLATSGDALLETIAQAVGLVATRRELGVAYAAKVEPPAGLRLAWLSAIVHRLERGLRLM